MSKKRYQDNSYPSVTEIVSKLLPKEWEKFWYAKTTGVAAARVLVKALQTNMKVLPKEEETIEGWAKRFVSEAAIERRRATDEGVKIGVGVHKALAKWTQGTQFDECCEGLSDEQIKIFSRFTSQLADRTFPNSWAEVKISSDKWKLNGTPDLVAREEGVLKVFDWKTSKRMDKQAYCYQLGGYGLLIEEMIGEEPKEGEVWRMGVDLIVEKPLIVKPLSDWMEKFKRLREVYADVVGK